MIASDRDTYILFNGRRHLRGGSMKAVLAALDDVVEDTEVTAEQVAGASAGAGLIKLADHTSNVAALLEAQPWPES
jgi:hypothetical protein